MIQSLSLDCVEILNMPPKTRLICLCLLFLGQINAVLSGQEKCPHGPIDHAPVLFGWVCAQPEAADRATLATDRPDFTEASNTVGLGHLQLELGYTYSFVEDGAERTSSQSFPETLFRIGMFRDWFELRIGWTALQQTSRLPGIRRSNSGSDDLYLGAKLALTQQEGWLPEMALIPQAFVPIGEDFFSSNEFLPGLNWIYAWEINDWLSIAGSTQGNRAIDSNEASYLEIAQSMTAAVSLTDRVGWYTEWFGLFPNSPSDDTKPAHFLNGGLTYLINDNLQYDVRAGLGSKPTAR